MSAGSGKTLAFLLPIIAVLHCQKHQQQQQQPQQQQLPSEEDHPAAVPANRHAAPLTKQQKTNQTESVEKRSKRGTVTAQGNGKTTAGIIAAATAPSEASLKGSSEAILNGSPEAATGPGAIILAPSRELAAQTARCLLLLLKGLKLRCTLLTAAVAAGTDFSKVHWQLHLCLFQCKHCMTTET